MIEIVRPDLQQMRDAARLGEALHAESAYSWLPYDRQKVMETLLAGDANPAVFGRVAVIDGEVTGFIMGEAVEYLFCRERWAVDHVIYVTPETRGYASAPRLVKAFEAWAFGLGCRQVNFGISSAINPKHIVRFYERLGYTNVGAIMVKKLEG